MRVAGATGAGGLLAALLGAACATVPEPPDPVMVEPAAAVGGERAVLETERDVPAGGAPVSLPAPPALWLSPEIVWEPSEPIQGTAVGVRIRLRDGSRPPRDVALELAGRAVGVAETPEGWFGVAALPLDSAGLMTLRARFLVDGDSTIEAVRLVAVAERGYESRRLSIGARGPPDPELDERIRRERERIGAAVHGFTPSWQGGEGFEWPRPRDVTSTFGQRRLFAGQVRGRHMGLDLRGRRSDPVRAPAGGRVALAGSFYFQGNAVYIDHGLGVFSALFHLESIEVREGERVERGQIVGRVGSTGRSTAPHLHWSAYVGGENVDPASFFHIDFPVAPIGSATARDR